MVRVRERNPEVKKQIKFTLDLGIAYDDQFLVPDNFVEYLKTNFKVNGVKGNLEEDVQITNQGKSNQR